ncbi:DDHD domain-containing protein [Neurospora tetraspora]|uniref:DDHD domain-containing protein n=1 Tax=Neurospora tetraspora TaxID=94610 RepID=A0AAE0JDM8_9PEZI|nr:DDHD domain-containing protein [Neurospora tetraspora]
MAPTTGTGAGAADKKPEKSYLASAVDSINPWAANRSTTPAPKEPPPPKPVVPVNPNPGDHSTNPFYGQSFKRYPPDCPPLNVQWFHAVDVPKRKPKFLQSKPDDDKKTQAQPKKYAPFSSGDSRALEVAYQARLEELEQQRANPKRSNSVRLGSKRPRVVSGDEANNTNLESTEDEAKNHIRVPVNEDFLFDVDLDDRELAPVYWEGPVYEVRRGTWFYQEGSTVRPCEENLAAQLEEGYLKIRPWMYPIRTRSDSGTKTVTPKTSVSNLKAAAAAQKESPAKTETTVVQHQPQTYRLFGAYMNNIATYHDENTAWLSSEGVLSWVTSTVYERFAGGGYMSGVKLVRGYNTETKKPKDDKRPSTPTGTKSSSTEQDEKLQKALKRRSAPAGAQSLSEDAMVIKEEGEEDVPEEIESTRARLTRQISNLIEGVKDPEAEAEAIRKREEKEIRDDYNARLGETQGREIEHIILVTHGIGQLLGKKIESVNFVHDVNMLRKTLKETYSSSADLRALNGEIEVEGPGNSRVQVLPVVWRHLLDFPKRKPKRREHDLGEAPYEEDEYPSLEDITIEGVAFARSLISDLALDVLLYQSAYRETIVEIVSREANRIYKLFKDRNPNFKGKVHVIGHSLGSAIMFDILCRQREKRPETEPFKNPLKLWPTHTQDRYEPKEPKELAFEFDVEDFYALGSPIGLFQMLKGRTIAARHLPNVYPSESPLNPEYMDDPFFLAATAQHHHHHHHNSDQSLSPITNLPYSISSPKVAQLFNIFHPSDPISYRLEPLISPAMSTLKPQALPYTKKSIFGSVAPQGLTGIGAKVGQSVSGLWSSLSAGIASSLLNRSLGLSQEDVANINASQAQNQNPSPGAGTNIAGGVISPESSKMSDAQRSEKTAERMRQLANAGHDGTLIDDELETLFSKFERKRLDMVHAAKEGGSTAAAKEEWVKEEAKAQKLKREEMKVRALNRNGRVDYSIQESVLDFNPINTIASHMSYWADEDVCHFILSQMLVSNRTKTPRV